jgi:hypothetical protein
MATLRVDKKATSMIQTTKYQHSLVLIRLISFQKCLFLFVYNIQIIKPGSNGEIAHTETDNFVDHILFVSKLSWVRYIFRTSELFS